MIAWSKRGSRYAANEVASHTNYREDTATRFRFGTHLKCHSCQQAVTHVNLFFGNHSGRGILQLQSRRAARTFSFTSRTSMTADEHDCSRELLDFYQQCTKFRGAFSGIDQLRSIFKSHGLRSNDFNRLREFHYLKIRIKRPQSLIREVPESRSSSNPRL